MKKLLWVVLLSLTISTSQVLAQFKIRSISKEKGLISVDIGSEANVKPGDELTSQWRDKECNFRVTKIDGNKAVADVRECDVLDRLKPGDTVTMSDFQSTGKYNETAPVSNPEYGRKKTTWDSEGDVSGFSILAGYNLASEVEFEDTGTTADWDVGGAPFIGVRYFMTPEYGTGFMAGLSYEFSRTFEGSTGKFSLIPLEISGIFRNDKLYGFGGINMAFISKTNISDSVSPALGIQLGGGYFVAPKFAIELMYKTTNFDWEDVDAARLWGFALRGAYHF